MKLNDAILGGVFVLLAIAVLVESRTFPTLPSQPYGPGTFPTIIAVIMLIAGGGQIWAGKKSSAPLVVVQDWAKTDGAMGRMLAVPAFVITYILLSKTVGFPLLAPVLTAALLLMMKVRPVVALPIAVVATAGIWFLFAWLLLVPLPLGLLTEVIY